MPTPAVAVAVAAGGLPVKLEVGAGRLSSSSENNVFMTVRMPIKLKGLEGTMTVFKFIIIIFFLKFACSL